MQAADEQDVIVPLDSSLRCAISLPVIAVDGQKIPVWFANLDEAKSVLAVAMRRGSKPCWNELSVSELVDGKREDRPAWANRIKAILLQWSTK